MTNCMKYHDLRDFLALLEKQGELKRIQRGVGRWVPNEMLGMHVGARRSHTTGRSHSIELRTLTTLFGWMGVECDPRQLNDHEQRVLGEAIALHKQHRALLHAGDAVRTIGTAHSRARQAF